MPETPLRARQRFDLLGAVLLGAGVGASLVYLSEGSSWGWGKITCLAYLIGGLVLLAAFVAWEARVPEPMMELSLLRSPRVLIVMLNALLLTAVISMTYIAVAYLFCRSPRRPRTPHRSHRRGNPGDELLPRNSPAVKRVTLLARACPVQPSPPIRQPHEIDILPRYSPMPFSHEQRFSQ